MPNGVKTFAAFAAAGLSGLIALAGLNIVADKTNIAGLKTLRDYIIRTH